MSMIPIATRSRSTRGWPAVTVAAALILAACGEGEPSAPGGVEATAVVASFFPLAEAAERAGGTRVVVTNVTPIGADPHDVELSPSEVDAVLDADLLLYQGGGFQPAIETLVDRREGRSVDVLQGLDLLDAEEEGHEEDGHDEQGDEHEAEEWDPHVWLDPLRYAQIVERIGDALGEVDPQHREEYRANAMAHAGDVRGLHERFDERLRGCDRDLLVVTHEAFGYLADRYDLHQEAIAGISPESEPDPRRLSELVTLVEEEDVTTIFTEPLISPEVAETLAREAGVETAVLSPLEGLTEDEEAAGDTYLTVMERNLEAIAVALDC
jgi:zinc transport system substrate-binding protein